MAGTPKSCLPLYLMYHVIDLDIIAYQLLSYLDEHMWFERHGKTT